MAQLTHIDDAGAARMVDVHHKPATTRMARAQAHMTLTKSTRDVVCNHAVAKVGPE